MFRSSSRLVRIAAREVNGKRFVQEISNPAFKRRYNALKPNMLGGIGPDSKGGESPSVVGSDKPHLGDRSSGLVKKPEAQNLEGRSHTGEGEKKSDLQNLLDVQKKVKELLDKEIYSITDEERQSLQTKKAGEYPLLDNIGDDEDIPYTQQVMHIGRRRCQVEINVLNLKKDLKEVSNIQRQLSEIDDIKDQKQLLGILSEFSKMQLNHNLSGKSTEGTLVSSDGSYESTSQKLDNLQRKLEKAIDDNSQYMEFLKEHEENVDRDRLFTVFVNYVGS